MLINSDYEITKCQELFQQYLNRYSYAFETKKGYEKDLELFVRFISEEKGTVEFTVLDIEKEDIVRFMDYGRECGHRTNTIARRLSTLKSFYKFLVYELDFPVDVAARIKVPKAYIPLTNILTERQIEDLLKQAKDLGRDYHLLFSTLYYTGSRLTPVRTLEWQHVYLDQKLIYFPRIKGGKDLYVPMHDHLVELFYDHLEVHDKKSRFVFPSRRFPNQPMSAADIRAKLRIVAEKAGIDASITPHTIRHCTATHLTMKQIDQRTIASILGHSDLRSTMRYQHLNVDHLRGPINCL